MKMNNPLNDVKPETWYRSPAAYITIAHSHDPSNRKYRPIDLKDKNPPLFWYSEGIWGYYDIWVTKINLANLLIGDGQWFDVQNAFLKSLFFASFGFKENIEPLLKNFCEGNIMRKISILFEAQRKLANLSMHQKEQKNRLEVASWSATWLTNHFWELQRINTDKFEPQKDIVNEILEIPLRDVLCVRSAPGTPTFYCSYI